MVKEKFELSEEKTEDIIYPNDKGVEIKRGEKEILVFTGPEGKIKLEFEDKETIIDQKSHYSHQGGSGRTEFIFDPEERSHVLNAYKWSDETNDWEKIQWQH